MLLQTFFKGNNYIKTMSMRINKIEYQTVNQRRKLRSTAKIISQSTTIKDSPVNEKDSDLIKTQIDQIQNVNPTLRTYPIFEDVKIVQEPLPQKEYELQKNSKVNSFNNNQSQCQEIQLNPHSLQISPEQLQNSLEIQLHSRSLVNCHNENKQLKINTPNSKSNIRLKGCPEDSLYHSQKVSYRKKKSSNITSVPFRKCLDPFESKIVSLINKLFYDKINLKEIQFLCDKIQKISNKDMFNPFVVSGIQTIIMILELKGDTHVTTASKLKNEIKNLTEKIWEELGRTDDYESFRVQERTVPIKDIKPKIIKKIYKILINIKKQQPQKARQKSYMICEAFFNKSQSVREKDIMGFFKDYQFLAQ